MKKILILVLILLIPIKVCAFNLGDAAILMEEDTKRVLVSKNIHKKKLIASTTKIMTAVLAIESGKLNDMVTANEKILESYGSNIYLKIGEEMRLEDMVYGLMMQSGNDAALMIADYLGGYDNFVDKMNDKARKIGMNDTVFTNPHGLDEKTKNYSTAYDMALLMRYANSIDKFKTITSCKKHKVTTNDKTYVWKNKNKLLYTYKYTTGGKTGFTKKARRTLVTSAGKSDLHLIVVTLNNPNDFKTHKDLYEYGFNNYKMVKVLDRKKISLPSKNMYIQDDYYYPITKREKSLIMVDYKPGKNKKKAGYVEVILSGKVIHKEPVYTK